jgi:hypothetical protein
MTAGDRLDPARELVTRFLSGELTQETAPEIFEDDAFMFAVAKLDEQDPEWLLRRLADRRLPVSQRVAVLGPMVMHYAEGHALLGQEAPELLRNFRDPAATNE